MTRGRYDEAEKIILKMAKRNGKPLPDLSLLRSFAKVGYCLVCLSKVYTCTLVVLLPKGRPRVITYADLNL